MHSIVDLLNPILWGVAALGAVIALIAGPHPKRDVRLAASTLLAIAALGLLASLAVAAWLPPRALLVHADGTTGDPRVFTDLILGIAALAALAPALRSLRLPPFGLLGLLLPGLALGGLLAAVSSFVGLGAPAALAAVLVGGVALGTGVVVFARLRWTGPGAIALQAGATGLLLVAGALSLHGARASALEFHEGAAIDTLGNRVVLGTVQAPHDSLRRMEFLVVGARGHASVWTALEGRPGSDNRSTAGGALFGGPVIVPLGLQEIRPEAHGVVWLAKGDTIAVGDGTVRFAGFRILPGDTVRMLADLDVTTAGRTQRVSPGMYASAKGTTPFAAVAEGLGPIAAVKIDADNHRVALMLPAPSAAAVNRVVTASLHLRPGLPFAWLGGALVVLAFLLGLGAPAEAAPARA